MCIIQVHMPTTEHEEEMEAMYEKIDDETNDKDYTVVMGDFMLLWEKIKMMDMSAIIVSVGYRNIVDSC